MYVFYKAYFLHLGIKRLSENTDWNSSQKTQLLLPVEKMAFKFTLG